MRRMSITVISIWRPVGGMPANSPSWVPWKTLRVTTLSPSATWSSTVARKSGKAARNMSKICRTPSTPGDIPGAALWLTNSGCSSSSKALSLPAVWYSSTKRRTTCLFCSGFMRAASVERRPRTSVDLPNQQVVLHGEQRGSCAARDADLRVDVLHVALGGAARDHELAGDLRVRQAACHEAQHLDLAIGEIGGPRRPRSRGGVARSRQHGAHRVGVEHARATLGRELARRGLRRMRRAMRPRLGHGLERLG